MLNLIKRILSIILIIIIFYFLVITLIKNWERIPFETLHFNIVYLISSFVFLFLNYLLGTAGWKFLINQLGDKPKFKDAFWIIALSQSAKYIPGGIWYPLGRIYLAKTKSLKIEAVTISLFIETFFVLLSGIILFLLSINFTTQWTSINYFLFCMIIFLFLLILYPPILSRIINFALTVTKRPKMELKLTFLFYIKLSIYFFGLWFAQIIGFYFLIASIYPLFFLNLPYLIAAYTISWIGGFLIILAPAGLGIREGIMTLFLSTLLPNPLPIVISLLSRIWIIIFDVAMFFVGVTVYSMNKNK